MIDFSPIEAYLCNVDINITNDGNQNIKNNLKLLKSQAVENNDQQAAKLAWCYEQILIIQQNYLSAFDLMKLGKFYDAWCKLERVEIDLHSLERHYEQPSEDSFKLIFIEKNTRLFQSLFPYKLFISPGMLYLEKKCSICKSIVSLRNPCGHKKGEIYNGEMCVYEITKVRVLELSIVPNPAQKYSVLFTTNQETGEQIDHYNYSMVQYVINGLRGPFDAWNYIKTTKRHPHSLFSHIDKNDQCPCGSKKKYKNCCLPNPEGVIRPHIEVFFNLPPPENLPSTVFPKYKEEG